MSMLKKAIVDLTPQERQALVKPIGTPGRPYPMPYVGTNPVDGTPMLNQMGVIESATNPLAITSDRDYAFIIGLAMRDMPSPSMLPLFKDAIERRRFDNKRRLQFLMGDPGTGKSYMAGLIAKMRDPEGAINVDCGGKNLAELLYEMVLDFSTDRKFYDAFEDRLASGNLHAASVGSLKATLGDAFTAIGDGTFAVDWEKVQNGAGRTRNDEGDFTETQEAYTRRVRDALSTVADLEGLGGGQNALGLTTQEGPLIRAYREGREIILDEYNKSKEGTDDSLQTVLQFLAGEIDECTVENKLKEKGNAAQQSFTFSRSNLKAGFFVTFTGNATVDGKTTRSLSKSAYSRLQPQMVPLATVEDWQHRICQILTGLPISTLYKAGEAQWDQSPATFTKKLKEWRTLGLSDKDRAKITPFQMQALERWQDTLEFTASLATFMHQWSQLTDPNSPLLQQPSLADVLMEIDEEYNKVISVDFRLAGELVRAASEIRSSITPGNQSQGFADEAWDKAPVLEEGYAEDPAYRFGTRFFALLMRRVAETTVALKKDKLYQQLRQSLINNRFLPTEHKDAAAHRNDLVTKKLDFNPYLSSEETVKAKLAQSIIAQAARAADTGIRATDEQIVSLYRLKDTLANVRAAETATEEVGQNQLFTVNGDLDQVSFMPFARAVSLDAAPLAGTTERRHVAASELASVGSYLQSLVLPDVGRHNVLASFSNGIEKSGLVNLADGDPALSMASSATNATGLGVTTVVLRGEDGKPATLHVVHDSALERTLLVGPRVSSALRTQLELAGISYVNREAPNARGEVEGALASIIGATRARQDLVRPLKDAFLMRNGTKDADADRARTLGELLVDATLPVIVPHFIRVPEGSEGVPVRPANVPGGPTPPAAEAA